MACVASCPNDFCLVTSSVLGQSRFLNQEKSLDRANLVVSGYGICSAQNENSMVNPKAVKQHNKASVDMKNRSIVRNGYPNEELVPSMSGAWNQEQRTRKCSFEVADEDKGLEPHVRWPG